jgi:NAD(P)-dependent dehydrogenase (short-subunit alcohol dehydrogenase family)
MKKKFTLITGASSGIGKEIAVQLSSSHHVILHGRDQERLLATKANCDQSNDQLIWCKDLGETESIESGLANFIALEDIEIDKFVYCAGYMKMVPLKLSNIDVLNKTFNVNVIAPSLLTRVLTQKKINSNALKAVVFISSNLSNMGAKAMSAYGASKGALDSLMRCLAVELAPAIRLNSVLPGAVITEMTQSVFNNEEIADRLALGYPLGIGQPNDIFQMVDFLLSDKAKWVTGQQFTIDGGRSINISA